VFLIWLEVNILDGYDMFKSRKEKENFFSYFLSQFFSCLHHYFDILTGSHIADDK